MCCWERSIRGQNPYLPAPRHQNRLLMLPARSPLLFSLGSDDCRIDAACKLSRATNFTLTTIDCACLIRGGFWQLSQSGSEPKSFTLTPWLFAPSRAHIAKLYGVKNPINNEETRLSLGSSCIFSLPLTRMTGPDLQYVDMLPVYKYHKYVAIFYEEIDLFIKSSLLNNINVPLRN